MSTAATAASSAGHSPGWFGTRPVAVKIGAAIVLLALVAIGLTGLAVQRIGSLADAGDTLYTDSIEPLERLGEAQRSFQGDRSRHVLYAVAAPETRATLAVELAERRVEFDEQMATYLGTLNNPADAAPLVAATEEYYAFVDSQLIPIADTGNTATALALAEGPLKKTSSALSDAFGVEQARQGEDAKADAAAGQELARQSRWTLWIALVVGIAAAGLLAGFVVRGIVRTVRSVQTSVDALAQGDLTVVPEVRSGDELGRMAAALGTAQESLREVLSSVVSSADAV
ncbi:methyl-accepting chemotaxis protein, partial [Geodermatophilus sp. YIM 151500]|uniref:HAMP domain-containing protein n=1 Tax=Geodermatophilus sp. YIM 151500 TaxID=2984531 RepID=UPI0021E485B5